MLTDAVHPRSDVCVMLLKTGFPFTGRSWSRSTNIMFLQPNYSSPPNSSSSLKCIYVNVRLDTMDTSFTIMNTQFGLHDLLWDFTNIQLTYPHTLWAAEIVCEWSYLQAAKPVGAATPTVTSFDGQMFLTKSLMASIRKHLPVLPTPLTNIWSGLKSHWHSLVSCCFWCWRWLSTVSNTSLWSDVEWCTSIFMHGSFCFINQL